MAKKLKVSTEPVKLKRLEHFDIELPEEIQSSATEIEVTADTITNGNHLREISLPPQTLVIMVRRGEDFFVPTGQSELEQGDQLLVLTDNDVEMANRYKEEQEEEENHFPTRELVANTRAYIIKMWKKIKENK